jgi:hypothetical protein
MSVDIDAVAFFTIILVPVVDMVFSQGAVKLRYIQGNGEGEDRGSATKGRAEIRNPKVEGRRKAEIRRPKVEDGGRKEAQRTQID